MGLASLDGGLRLAKRRNLAVFYTIQRYPSPKCKNIKHLADIRGENRLIYQIYSSVKISHIGVAYLCITRQTPRLIKGLEMFDKDR